jgi:hypothetical protein
VKTSVTQILVVLVMIGLVPIGMLVQRRWPRLRNLGSGLLVSYITLVLILSGTELYFRYVHAASDGLRARENWMNRYWHLNSLGFRDREWRPADYDGKQRVIAIGDSFTAGWGVENPLDRFPDVLQAQLGAEYAVFNLGMPGSSTRDQLVTLANYPVQEPDVVLWQYFLNDIEGAALSIGQFQEPPQIPAWMRESYFANYVFALGNSGFGPAYWDWEYAAYDNYGIWQIHQQELEQAVRDVQAQGARLIVVIFPNMQDPFRSIPYVDRVAQVFEAQGVTAVLKLFDAVERWPVAERIVSPRDAHPSAAFHRYVGEEVYRLYFAEP